MRAWQLWLLLLHTFPASQASWIIMAGLGSASSLLGKLPRCSLERPSLPTLQLQEAQSTLVRLLNCLFLHGTPPTLNFYPHRRVRTIHWHSPSFPHPHPSPAFSLKCDKLPCSILSPAVYSRQEHVRKLCPGFMVPSPLLTWQAGANGHSYGRGGRLMTQHHVDAISLEAQKSLDD